MRPEHPLAAADLATWQRYRGDVAAAESGGDWISRTAVHSERGANERARDAYACWFAVDRGDLRASLKSHLPLPTIYADAPARAATRDNYRQGLATPNCDCETIDTGPRNSRGITARDASGAVDVSFGRA